ncbi:phage virion morphogenesis protein [Jeongeupia chitinilytica]|uniref:Virion morphogenesis protein n=1 Tax=Jeongeupia chitinilytica TaxID=1041641 RepID=A0ABQ3GZ62_9NEIS|nr:phage virion morphogenesis protein [Jeongeupia chitinilytica]GHD59865.1 virion morphogenesis protein [Jeongeupia chitinilytica]
MDDLSAIEDWASGLLARLSPVERRKLMRQIATALRQSQAKRIAEQKDPDGVAYAPRSSKRGLRGKKGRIRRSMFAKLRTARHLKAESTTDEASIGFSGRDARIAGQHQEGSVPRLPRRRLLGFRPKEVDLTHELILSTILTKNT